MISDEYLEVKQEPSPGEELVFSLVSVRDFLARDMDELREILDYKPEDRERLYLDSLKEDSEFADDYGKIEFAKALGLKEYEDCMKTIITVEDERLRGLVTLYEGVSEAVSIASVASTEIPKDQIEAAKDLAGQELEQVFIKAYSSERATFVNSLQRIFPDNLAEVNIPSDYDDTSVRIPPINKWQRSKGIRENDQADKVYMTMTARAKQYVLSAVQERCAPEIMEITPAIPGAELNDQIDETLRELTTSLVQCHEKCFGEESDKHAQDVEPAEIIEAQTQNVRQIIGFLQEMTDQSSLLRDYGNKIVEANRQSVENAARIQAREHTREILAEGLSRLQQQLADYEPVTPSLQVSSNSPKRRKSRRRRSGARNNPEGAQSDKSIKPGDELTIDTEIFSWLEDEFKRSIICVENGHNGSAVVLDARSEDALNIEHRMTGYEAGKKRRKPLSCIEDQLKFFAQKAASANGGSDAARRGLAAVKDRDSQIFKHPIHYRKEISPNAKRVYVSIVDVDKLRGSEMKNELTSAGVGSLILFLGACDKAGQLDLLHIFTGKSTKQLRAEGVGSI